jgi:hypothetical protein
MTPLYVSLLAVPASGARVGETHISPTTPTVIDLQQHRNDLPTALRAGLVVVAAVSEEASGVVVTSGAIVTETPGERGKVNVSAGELYDRAPEKSTPIPAKAKLALKAPDRHKDRTSLVVVKASDGSASVVDGTLAEPGESVAPAAGEGNVALATVLVKQSFPKPMNPIVITDVRVRP